MTKFISTSMTDKPPDMPLLQCEQNFLHRNSLPQRTKGEKKISVPTFKALKVSAMPFSPLPPYLSHPFANDSHLFIILFYIYGWKTRCPLCVLTGGRHWRHPRAPGASQSDLRPKPSQRNTGCRSLSRAQLSGCRRGVPVLRQTRG